MSNFIAHRITSEAYPRTRADLKIVTPHVDREGAIDIFLAGGIRDCPDWQSYALARLSSIAGLRVANPRRAEGIEMIGAEAADQIAWEQRALSRSRSVLFWFPEETLCPIALLELGIEMGRARRPIFIGTHPNYRRRFDLEHQVALARASNQLLPTRVHDDIDALLRSAMESFG